MTQPSGPACSPCPMAASHCRISYVKIRSNGASRRESLIPSLQATISMGTDADLYEDVVNTSVGLFNENLFPFWYRALIATVVCSKSDVVDFVEYLRNAPFNDPNPEKAFGPRFGARFGPRFGPRFQVFMCPDMSRSPFVGCDRDHASFQLLPTR